MHAPDDDLTVLGPKLLHLLWLLRNNPQKYVIFVLYLCAGKRTGAVASLGSRGPERPKRIFNVINPHYRTEILNPQLTKIPGLGKTFFAFFSQQIFCAL